MGLKVHLHSLLTSATEMCGQPHAAAPSPPGKDLPVPTKYEAGWGPKSSGEEKIFLPLLGFEPRIVQPLA